MRQRKKTNLFLEVYFNYRNEGGKGWYFKTFVLLL